MSKFLRADIAAQMSRRVAVPVDVTIEARRRETFIEVSAMALGTVIVDRSFQTGLMRGKPPKHLGMIVGRAFAGKLPLHSPDTDR